MFAAPFRVFNARCFSVAPSSAIPANNISADRLAGAALGSSMASSPPNEARARELGVAVSLAEWQGWGTSSPVPAMVADLFEDLRGMVRDADDCVSFGGLGVKLKGMLKAQEDIKQRAVYQSLTDSENKLQFFSARQIACRLLGSRGYLCQKCWLAMEDCMCSKLARCSLWPGIKFWVYMHPKDFLRQNNTGKLLWQIFGAEAASMCIFGILEHEEIMWDAFRHSGKNTVWFLYPSKNTTLMPAQDLFFNLTSARLEGQPMEIGEKPLNFVLIDGTWSNSTSMYKRLKEKWMSTWGDENLPCISLSATGVSVMHKLRPQPSWDRTCTAAAAASLLREMQGGPEIALEEQAEAVEKGLDALLDALTARRLRMGRSITRRERNRCLISG